MKRSSLVLGIAGGFFLLFSLARLTLYLAYFEYFSALSLWESVFSFASGLRFDGSVIFVFLGFVCLMLLLPVRAAAWRRFWTGVALLEFLLFALVLCVDIIYFGFAGRHLADEARFLGNETGFILAALRDYSLAVCAFVLGGLAAAVLFLRAAARQSAPEKRLGLKLFLCLAVSFLFIRGSVSSGKPLAMIDAFTYGQAQGNLTLNGAYTTYRHLIRKTPQARYYLSDAEAFALLGLDNNLAYPLVRDFAGQARKMNIVLLIMESWSADLVGATGGRGGSRPTLTAWPRAALFFCGTTRRRSAA